MTTKLNFGKPFTKTNSSTERWKTTRPKSTRSGRWSLGTRSTCMNRISSLLIRLCNNDNDKSTKWTTGELLSCKTRPCYYHNKYSAWTTSSNTNTNKHKKCDSKSSDSTTLSDSNSKKSSNSNNNTPNTAPSPRHNSPNFKSHMPLLSEITKTTRRTCLSMKAGSRRCMVSLSDSKTLLTITRMRGSPYLIRYFL